MPRHCWARGQAIFRSRLARPASDLPSHRRGRGRGRRRPFAVAREQSRSGGGVLRRRSRRRCRRSAAEDRRPKVPVGIGWPGLGAGDCFAERDVRRDRFNDAAGCREIGSGGQRLIQRLQGGGLVGLGEGDAAIEVHPPLWRLFGQQRVGALEDFLILRRTQENVEAGGAEAGVTGHEPDRFVEAGERIGGPVSGYEAARFLLVKRRIGGEGGIGPGVGNDGVELRPTRWVLAGTEVERPDPKVAIGRRAWRRREGRPARRRADFAGRKRRRATRPPADRLGDGLSTAEPIGAPDPDRCQQRPVRSRRCCRARCRRSAGSRARRGRRFALRPRGARPR